MTKISLFFCLFFIPVVVDAGKMPDKEVAGIRYEQVKLTEEERKILSESLEKFHVQYDPREKMLNKTITAWNYHTDAESGVVHDVRISLQYAVGLLDVGDKKYTRQAFDIIDKIISLQDTVSSSKTCGIWPYFQEEPLATKKSPPDFNWADFNSVSLLDIYMGHEARLPAELKAKIKRSLILAARSIQKRDVQPGYTNIAIMGTYVTFTVSSLFALPEMKTYATTRLNKFYDYTLERGFTEYNSPTYTIVALDELDRMKRHIVDPAAKPRIDSLYSTAWSVIAKHFHKPTGQWAGPHSRSYNSFLQSSVKGMIKGASDGKIDLPGATVPRDVKIKHRIPAYLLHYFLTPTYPRTEIDVLATNEPKVIGTTHLTSTYALASANRSSLWNQRRPFLAYWGTQGKPYYLQIRFLHDLYDFSAADFYSEQKENQLLGAVIFSTNGGDKHINIDKLKQGKFKAKDLRLRFELGNYLSPDKLSLPGNWNDGFTINVENIKLRLRLFQATFGDLKGHWEKGGDEKASWLDYVIYTGQEKEIDLSAMQEAVFGFTFDLDGLGSELPEPDFEIKENLLQAKWQSMQLRVPVKPAPQPGNL